MDLYNYWLMEKVAEEEKQESFAKRHKKKLIGGAAIAGAVGAGKGFKSLEEHGYDQLGKDVTKAYRLAERTERLAQRRRASGSSIDGEGKRKLSRTEASAIKRKFKVKYLDDLRFQDGFRGKAKRAFYGAKALGKKIFRRGK